MKANILLSAWLFVLPAFAQNSACVIPGRGHFQIHAGTGGLFGGFAHDHLIEAQQIEGCAQIDSKDLTRSTIKLNFPTAGVKVVDAKESAEDRAKIQRTMETDVLRVSEYPQATFESTAIDRAGPNNEFRVRGTLTIRGKTQPAIVPVTFTQLSDGGYHAIGTYKFKQSTFGIRPIQLAGGTVKVKDELSIDFEIFLK